MLPWSAVDPRRVSPRIPVHSLASEVHQEGTRHALVTDLSGGGLCLLRPIGGPRTRTVQLEVEIPGIDEVIWARGAVCFDQVRQLGGGDFGPSGLMRQSGVRLVAAASRHRRLLREFVVESFRAWRKSQIPRGV